jgi:colanic acid/amylovoran biosynthesis glycosyltransferase
MRVCIVTPLEPGSTETFIRAHLNRLPFEIIHLHGWGGSLVCENYNLMDAARSKAPGRWLNILPRMIEYRLRSHLFPSLSEVEVVADFLKQRNVDVVLGEYGPTAALMTPACGIAGVPLVAHFHGYDASNYDTMREFSERYERMFHYAAAVISVSHVMTSALKALKCPEDIIVYNPYGPAPEFFEIDPDYRSDTLIAVGRHTGQKAPYLTLEAFRQVLKVCPNLRLVIIGDGELFEISERLVKAWGIQDRVELVGSAPPEVVRARMKEGFAFVQHSLRARNGDAEGMPVAILEAGAAGLPVVSTLHAGIPDAVVDGETGFLVEEGDVAAMAARIIDLAQDRQKAKAMGAQGRRRIRELFSMERHIGLLETTLLKAGTKQ